MSGIDPISLTQETRDPMGFASALGASFERYGFAVVADHGIDQAMLERANAASRAFFALPEAVKHKYHIKGGGGARGYTPFGIETAKGADHFDLKEFWHVGRPLPAGHRYADVMAPNVWPDELPAFKSAFLDLFDAFDAMSLRLMCAIARHLDLPTDFFAPALKDGNSVMRLLHYPPVPADAGGVRAGAHEDINTITLLLGADEAGLQVLDRDGRWLPINPPVGSLVVNIGDMLQRETNHVLPSTTHRVVNPPPERRGVPRYSMPFFVHYAPDYMIRTLKNCVSAERPDRYPTPISSHEYLEERLREINLK
jgi:isopenicillin N synthase-like dioxygenase